VKDTSRKVWVRLAVLWIGSVAVVAIAVFLTKGTGVTVETGRAYVGADQAGAIVDGVTYDIPVVDAIWQHADGSWQFGGSGPDCLAKQESMSPPFTFGWVSVTEPNGSTIRQVVWVSCAG
jgi:hypothetical protein